MKTNLSKNVKVILAKVGQATGITDVDTDVIDTFGFKGCMFLGSIATDAANNSAKVQQGAVANMSDAADLAGTSVNVAANGNSFMIDVYRPAERYLRVKVLRGTTTVTGDIYAFLYGGRTVPVTHGATIDAEFHYGPAEGTA